MNDRNADRITRAITLTPLVAAIAYLRFAERVPFDTFILGSGSWGFGLLLKMVAYHGIVRRLPHDPARLPQTALIHGVLSGVCELGMAVAAFAYLGTLTLPGVLAFGLAIGTIEALLPSNVLEGTDLAPAMKRFVESIGRLRGGRRAYYRQFLPALERWSATGIHIGTRGLVYVGLLTRNPFPWVLALAVFVLADGVGYRLIYGGKLEEPAKYHRFELALLGVAAACVGLFLVFWRVQ